MGSKTIQPIQSEKLEADITFKNKRDIIWMANGSVSATHSAYRGGAI